MPFFAYPIDPTGWLLPLARGLLAINYFIFEFLMLIAPIGIPILVVVVLGLFSWNLMKPVAV